MGHSRSRASGKKGLRPRARDLGLVEKGNGVCRHLHCVLALLCLEEHEWRQHEGDCRERDLVPTQIAQVTTFDLRRARGMQNASDMTAGGSQRRRLDNDTEACSVQRNHAAAALSHSGKVPSP
eukprot:3067000-Rhodomonas_salina.1